MENDKLIRVEIFTGSVGPGGEERRGFSFAPEVAVEAAEAAAAAEAADEELTRI